MPSVLQLWVQDLTYMQQSVLITAIRGPDGLDKQHLCKDLVRWMRRCVLISAFDGIVLEDPKNPAGGPFTGPCQAPDLDIARTWYLDSVDGLPYHFHMHMVHAVEVLGYKHPVKWIRSYWLSTYRQMIRDLHCNPETELQMDRRLGDNKADWQAAQYDGQQTVPVGVSVLVFGDANCLLMGKRKGVHGAGEWAPPGGRIEPGEDPLYRALLELKQETGIEPEHSIESFVAHAYNASYAGDEFWVTLFFIVGVPPNTLAKLCEPDKCEGWGWYAVTALPSPLFGPFAKLVSAQGWKVAETGTT